MREARCGKNKVFYTLEEKKSIVAKAYEVENNIRATARLYRCDEGSIRRWKKRFLMLGDGDYQKRKKNKSFHLGNKKFH